MRLLEAKEATSHFPLNLKMFFINYFSLGGAHQMQADFLAIPNHIRTKAINLTREVRNGILQHDSLREAEGVVSLLLQQPDWSTFLAGNRVQPTQTQPISKSSPQLQTLKKL